MGETFAGIASNGIRHAYIVGWSPELTFYSGAQVEVSGVNRHHPVDKYRPYTMHAEFDEHPGFLQDKNRIADFLA